MDSSLTGQKYNTESGLNMGRFFYVYDSLNNTTIYIALTLYHCIISNVETIDWTHEDIYRLYANTPTLYIRDSNICRLGHQ